jgi:hypothetical protein
LSGGLDINVLFTLRRLDGGVSRVHPATRCIYLPHRADTDVGLCCRHDSLLDEAQQSARPEAQVADASSKPAQQHEEPTNPLGRRLQWHGWNEKCATGPSCR